MTARAFFFAAILAMAPAAMVAEVNAEVLYAATVRPPGGGAPDAVAGAIYVVELSTGTARFLAPIRLEGFGPIGVTGLATHPKTGQFYAITTPLSTAQQSLVTIDPTTGIASLIGPLGYPGSDIAFSPAGALYAWLYQSRQVGQVDLATGASSPIGPARTPGGPGGIAIDREGIAFVAGNGGSGTLDTVDLGTGEIKQGPALRDAPFPAAINSMTFTPSGMLLAVNSNAGSPAEARLVAVNVATAAVSTIGTLPQNSDALAFTATGGPGHDRRSAFLLPLLVIATIVALLAAFRLWRR
jgi:hypothetical protein